MAWLSEVELLAAVEREAAAVCGDEGEGIVFERAEDAVEHVAGLVGRDRVGGHLEAFLESLLADLELACVVEGRQRWELAIAEPEDLEERRAAADAGGVLVVDLDGDVLRWQLADDGGEAAGRQGGGARFVDFRLDLSSDADVEVGGGELELAVARFEQDVREDRQGGARADDVLDLLQPFEELVLRDLKLHSGSGRLLCSG